VPPVPVLYVLDVAVSGTGRAGRAEVTAWRPPVPGIAEVFHARFTDHAYPSHTHDAWTLLLVDAGAVRYDLDRREHQALPGLVTLLPPHVPHDGRAATADGFRKRVLYLDTAVLGPDLVGAAVDRPAFADPALRQRVHQLHGALLGPGEELQAESRLAFIRDRLAQHLRRRVPAAAPVRDRGLAAGLRDLLDARVASGVTLDEAARVLGAHPSHLVRAFTRELGLPPHRYLTGRRVDLARRLLLDGRRPAEVATAAGFYDQAHLTRHFRRMLATTPAAYARSA
jgi:AraC-like DNA-binding protein